MNQTPNLNFTCMEFSTCSLKYQRENCGQVPRYFKREYKIPDNLFCNTILGQLLTSTHVKLNLGVLCVLKGQLKNIVCEYNWLYQLAYWEKLLFKETVNLTTFKQHCQISSNLALECTDVHEFHTVVLGMNTSSILKLYCFFVNFLL